MLHTRMAERAERNPTETWYEGREEILRFLSYSIGKEMEGMRFFVLVEALMLCSTGKSGRNAKKKL